MNTQTPKPNKKVSMKKMMLTLAIVVSSIGVAFAGEEEVNAKVLGAFKNEFKSATDIKWTIGTNYYQAAFVYNEQHVSAFYNLEGDLLGLTRYISPADLPLALQSDLKKSYDSYWISDLFEVSNDEGTTYYITLEDADTKKVLKATDGRSWHDYKKVKKA
jgi:hypothetical protein